MPDQPQNDRIPGENPDDDVLPIAPGRRRIAMLIGVVFLLVILGFLVWFVTTHTEQSGGGMMGHGEVAPAAVDAVASD